jgi:Asp-tRNA(Asn)/Glu-tRNA(Gln) amidotransferase B subunit
MNDFLNCCHKNKVNVDDCQVTSEHLGEIVDMLEAKIINLHLAKLVLQAMLEDPKESPLEVGEKKIVSHGA